LSEFIDDDEDVSHLLFTDDYSIIKVYSYFTSKIIGLEIFKES